MQEKFCKVYLTYCGLISNDNLSEVKNIERSRNRLKEVFWHIKLLSEYF